MKQNRRKRINLLTVFLLSGIIYMSINASLNIVKIISYKIKLAEIQRLHEEAMQSHKNMLSEIDYLKSESKNSNKQKLLMLVLEDSKDKEESLNLAY